MKKKQIIEPILWIERPTSAIMGASSLWPNRHRKWLEWTSNHQCTSWPFCPLNGLRFFIRCQMGFITIHFFLLLTIVFFILFFGSWSFSPRPDFTHNYHVHFPTLISTTPTLVPYLLFLTNIATLKISYPMDLAIIYTTYPTNLTTLLITYPTNLTIVLTTYLTDLVTLHTQPPYWHK
jgi:hypothetical protein